MSNCTFNLFCGGFVTIYQNIFLSCISGWLCGLGLLSSSPKCSVHQLSCLSTPVRTVPFLSLIGRSAFLNCPANVFVVSYSCSMFLLAGALSASCPTLDRVPFVCFDTFSHFSICCCALYLGHYFRCPCAAAVDCHLLVFLICIFLIVSAESQSFCCGFLLPSTYSNVVLTASLMWLQCLSMFIPSSSSYNSWRTLNILLNATLYYCAFLSIR